MDVSVVICTYSPELYSDFCDAIESILDQQYEAVEVIAIVDGTNAVSERTIADWGDHDRVTVYCNEENLGLSASRNRGIQLATGDVVAFMDDDAVADDEWVGELVSTYESTGVEAVGGRMCPLWLSEKPSYLPPEFFWLVGVTHRGFPDEGPVRNTFGSNISFRSDVLSRLNGFDEGLGRAGSGQGQGEETELAARLRAELDGTLYYTPDAIVYHKIFSHRTRLGWLLKRAFWQGYSKRKMEGLVTDSVGRERAFLGQLLTTFVPARLRSLIRSPQIEGLVELFALFLFTFVVGLGYLVCIGADRVDNQRT